MAPIPVHADPVKEEQLKRQAEKRRAIQALELLAEQQVALRRHVFFIPGWAGEDGWCWMRPYEGLLKGHAPITTWVERLVPKAVRERDAHFVTFSLSESTASTSFLDFATVLKAKIRDEIGEGEPCDLVGHSMGSLTAMAAITQPPNPLRGVVNLIAVGSPLRGIFYSKLVKPIDELLPFLKWELRHYTHVENLGEQSAPIRLMNQLVTRQRLLARIQALHALEGTQDMVVMRSARFRPDGLTSDEKRRIHHAEIGGAMHVGPAGITQDPRTVLAIMNILAEV